MVTTGPAAHRLRADCTRCQGLCCVAPAFAASADFAIDKPAGHPCTNLEPDFRCGIHEQLPDRGFAGCAVFDCFGAGQQVSTVVFSGRDWRDSPELADRMFAAFTVLRGVNEMLWYLDDAIARPAALALRADLEAVQEGMERLTRGTHGTVPVIDLDAHRVGVSGLLLQVSAMVRGAAGGLGPDLRRVDLVGARRRGADLGRADLRGALLLGADLRAADLRAADLLGADLRAADLRGADLREALFLAQSQVNAARGDRFTRLPDRVSRPPHWVG
jgi:hypothetical protein